MNKYKYFVAATPDSKLLSCTSFTYILESPGHPKRFSSWEEFISYCEHKELSSSLFDRMVFSVANEDDRYYTGSSLEEVKVMFSKGGVYI